MEISKWTEPTVDIIKLLKERIKNMAAGGRPTKLTEEESKEIKPKLVTQTIETDKKVK